MTISSETARADYTGNGTTNTYAYTWRIIDSTHLQVIQRTAAGVETVLALNTDYTVTGVGNAQGNVVLTAGNLASGYHLTVLPKVPQTQGTDLRNQGAYNAETVEDQLDLIVRSVQQVSDGVNRSLKAPRSVSPAEFNPDIPVPTQNKGKYLLVNGDGTGISAQGLPAVPLTLNNIPGYLKGALPVGASVGDIARVTDDVRGIWAKTANNWASLSALVVNAMEFGMDASRTAVQNSAAWAALAASIGSTQAKVMLPYGTLLMNERMNVPKNVLLEGHGRGRTVLDFTSAAGTFTESVCMLCEGGALTSLPALAANILPRAISITFASAPGVAAGDLIVIWDSAIRSYSAYRDEYYAGEMCVVESVSGSVVTLTAPILSKLTYASGGTVAVYKMGDPARPGFRGFSVIGKATELYPIWVRNARDFSFDDVYAERGEGAAMQVTRCYNVAFSPSCAAVTYAGTSIGGGLRIENCQVVKGFGGYYHAVAGGVITGGRPPGETGSIPNRIIEFVGSEMRVDDSTSGVSSGWNAHGNQEYIKLIGCTVEGSVLLAGDENDILDNLIIGKAGGGNTGINNQELSGPNHRLRGNKFKSTSSVPVTGQAAFITIGHGGTGGFGANLLFDGEMLIEGNEGEWHAANGNEDLIMVQNNGSTGHDIRVTVRRNKVSRVASTAGVGVAVGVVLNSGAAFTRVKVEDNDCGNMGISITGATRTYANRNKSIGATTTALAVSSKLGASPLYVEVMGNHLMDSNGAPLNIDMSAGAACVLGKVMGNTAVEGNKVTGGSALADSAFIMRNFTTAVVLDNIFGGTQASQQRLASYDTITTLCEQNKNRYYGTGAIIHSPASPYTIASPASGTLVIPPWPCEVVSITGTNAITSITLSSADEGRRLTLQFQGALTVTDGLNLKLAGNFVTTADDTISGIVFSSTFYETSRSVN